MRSAELDALGAAAEAYEADERVVAEAYTVLAVHYRAVERRARRV